MVKKPLSCKLGKHDWEVVGPKYATRDGYAIHKKCIKCGERQTAKAEPEKKEDS
jgi:hypothetical protein